MKTLLALLSFALSLFGWQFGGTHYSNRLHDGGTVLHSEAWVGTTAARFECVESSSGRCYYRLFPIDPAPACAQGDCRTAPLQAFTVAEGEELEVTGLPEFRLDVSPGAG